MPHGPAAPRPLAAPAATPPSHAEAEAAPPPVAPASAAELWSRVAAFVADKPARRAMVSQLTALEYDGVRAVLGCPAFALEAAKAQQRALAELLQGVLQRPVQVQIKSIEGSAPAPAAEFPAGPRRSGGPDGPGGRAGGASGGMSGGAGNSGISSPIRAHPLVQKAIDLFSARVIEVREGPEEAPRPRVSP